MRPSLKTAILCAGASLTLLACSSDSGLNTEAKYPTGAPRTGTDANDI